MSTLQIFAIRDQAIDELDRPFFAPAIGLAVRMFGDEINNAQSPMHRHPGDYTLHHLGTFDTSSGEFVTMAPVQISRGVDHVS